LQGTDTKEDGPPPAYVEVNNLRNKNTAGQDQIVTGLIEKGGQQLKAGLHKLILNI
jgi:hypothetical protein